jgi:hypothetical protein
MSRLRLREGRASKSRLRGRSDKAFITLNRAGIALVPRGRELTRVYCPSQAEYVEWSGHAPTPQGAPARSTGQVESRNAANDGKLSSHGNLGFAYPASLREPDAPGFECRPLYYTGEQHIGCLVEVTSQHLILDGFGRHRRHLQGSSDARGTPASQRRCSARGARSTLPMLTKGYCPSPALAPLVPREA